ncbi:MAG: ABC transporter substrate-binding protein [Desulfatiglandales bacterium]
MPKMSLTLMVLFGLTLSVVSGCNREEKPAETRHVEEIALSVTPWPGSAALYVAQEKGFFKAEGIKATFHPYDSGHLGLEAVLSRKVDFATVGDTPIARAALEGKPIAVIATLSEINRAVLIVARKDRGISSVADLKGKRVGVVVGTTADFFLHIFLTTSYINPSQVKIINLRAEEVVDALVGGEVDAVSTWFPHTTEARDKLGDNALVFENPSLYKMTWNIVTAKELTNTRPKLVQSVLRAIVRANAFILRQPDEAKALTLMHIGAKGPLLEKEWDDYTFTTALDQSLVLNLEDQARWMVTKRVGATKSPPNFMHFVYTDGMKAVLPEAVGIVHR